LKRRFDETASIADLCQGQTAATCLANVLSRRIVTMMFKQLDETVSVSPQILPQDVNEIAAAGFKSIICNRPDGESADQTPYAQIEAAAHAAGVPIRNIPVVSGAITSADVRAMQDALMELPKPVFAYCRSGARCTNLYALVQDMSD
jgi:sulfide:quinone oxidoreductase